MKSTSLSEYRPKYRKNARQPRKEATEIIILPELTVKYKIAAKAIVGILIMYCLGILIPIFRTLVTIRIKPICARITLAPLLIANPRTPSLPIRKNINAICKAI